MGLFSGKHGTSDCRERKETWKVFSDWMSNWHVILIYSLIVCHFRLHVSSSPPVAVETLLDQTQSRKAIIEELYFQPTNMSGKVKLSKTIWWICIMTRKLVSISTLTFIHSETIGSMGQSLSDNFTKFPYLTRPILLAKFETCRREKCITIYVLF